MCGAARESTGFAPGCGPEQGAPSSSDAGSRVGTSSPPSLGRPFVSLRPGSRFRPVYRQGVRKRAGAITVIRAEGRSGLPQVGIVAGRGVGGAVRRNRAKRRIREAIGLVPLQRNTAYVVVAGPDVTDAAFDQLTDWLRTATRESVERRSSDE